MLVSVTEDIDMSKPSDLVQGTLDMLLLKILALEPMNGFAVSQFSSVSMFPTTWGVCFSLKKLNSLHSGTVLVQLK